MRCEARRGRGWPPGGASVGDGHLIEEIKQAQPGPSKASKQASSAQEGRERGQGRAGQGRKTNQGSTRLARVCSSRATQPHGPEPEPEPEPAKERTKQKNQTTRSPARCRCHCAPRADFWFGPVGQLDPRGATAQESRAGNWLPPLQGGPARVLYEYPSPNPSRLIFPRLINGRHPDTASLHARPTARRCLLLLHVTR